MSKKNKVDPATYRAARPANNFRDSAATLLENAKWTFARIFKAHPKLAFGIAAIAILGGVFPPIILLLTRKVINLAMEVEYGQLSDAMPLLPWAGLMGFLILVESGLSSVKTYLNSRLFDDLNLSINIEMLDHAATLDMAYLEDPSSQDVLARAQQNPSTLFVRFTTQCLSIISSSIKIFALFGILIAIEPYIIAFALIMAPLYFFFHIRLTATQYEVNYVRATKKRKARYFSSHLTSRHLALETSILGLSGILIERFRNLMEEFKEEDKWLYKTNLKGSSLFVLLSGILGFGLVGRVALRALSGVLLMGDIAAFGAGVMQFRSAIERNILAITGVFSSSLYISNFRTFMEAQPRIKRGIGKKVDVVRGDIKVDDISFSYPGSKNVILKNISFDIRAGETVAIVGENGAGKTTLVKLLMRIYDPSDGAIFLDGENLTSLDLDSLLYQYSCVQQKFATFEATVHDNIAFGNLQVLRDDREGVISIAKDVGVDDMIEKMPEGYDTLLGRKFGEYDLSGGQWQRIVMARALAKPNSILIMDEPTSNQDAKGEAALFENVKRLTTDRTTILISHRFATVSLADRIVVLHEGSLVEDGSHEELMALNGHYATLYNVQIKAMMREK